MPLQSALPHKIRTGHRTRRKSRLYIRAERRIYKPAMTDHITALARIPDDTMARLTRKSTRAGLWHLAGHFGLIAVCSALIVVQVPFWGLLLPLQGVLLVFLFTLEHETTHQTPFANLRLNEGVGRLCGLILAVPFTWFRYFHLAHHRHTNDPDHDPELAAGPKPQTLRHYLIHVSGIPYWIALSKQIIRNARGKADADYLPTSALPRVTSEARWMLAFYVAALTTLLVSPLVLWLWLVPLVLGQPVLRLYLLAEHSRCAYVANMLENTRTTYTNRALRFIAWNMPYHAEHHAAPQVPFYQLPMLNTHLKDALQETSDGYVSFTRDSVQRLTH